MSVSFWQSPSFFEYFLVSRTRCLRLQSLIPSMSSNFFYWECYLETKIWAYMCSLLLRSCYFQPFSVYRVYKLRNISISLFIYPSLSIHIYIHREKITCISIVFICSYILKYLSSSIFNSNLVYNIVLLTLMK